MLPRDHALTPSAVSSADIPQFELKNDPPSDGHMPNQSRKTLQTISEFAPQHPITQGYTSSLLWTNNDTTTYCNPLNVGSKHSRHLSNSRRRSLPIQSPVSQHDYTGSLARPISSSAIPTVYSLGTAPNNSQGNARHNPRRRSMPLSFETRGRSLSPVAEGELSKQLMPQADSPLPASGWNRSGRKKSKSVSRGTEHQAGGWNARRERELARRDRAFIEANARRTREHLGLAIGSASTLPTATPVRTAKADDLIAQQSRYYSQLPSLIQPKSTHSSRRNSHSRDGRQVNGSIVDGHVFQDMATCNTDGTAPQSMLRRTLSATSDPRWNTHSKLINRGVVPVMRSASSNSVLSFAMAERPLAAPRSSSSLQTSSNSTRSSSSTKSSVSSSPSKPSQRSSSITYTRSLDHPLRQNPVTSSPEPCPALLQARVETNIPPPSMSHAFLGSQLIAQAIYSHELLVPQSPIASPGHFRTRSGSQPRVSAVHIQKVADKDDVIYRENPDKRVMSPAGVRDTARRCFKEEEDRRIAREKIQERVRRANELEEKRERELVEEGQDKKKKRSRGFLCGLIRKA